MVDGSGVESGGNVIVVLLDDVGIDKFPPFDENAAPLQTPVMQALADRGVLFRNAWAQPSCSPMRASGLTGRDPTQTGIGRWIHSQTNPIKLELEEITLPELLKTAETPYDSGLIGKWHLTEWSGGDDPGGHAMDQGFDRQRGAMANPEMTFTSSGQSRDYFHWEKNTDGVFAYTETYMTTDTADEAILYMQEVEGPFFMWLAFNAPHTPIHAPPAELYHTPLESGDGNPEYYGAMLEALDTELGRVFDSMTEEQVATTTIILLGDNGTDERMILEPWDPARAKHTVFDGGVRVPFIVAGPYATPGTETDALIQTTDIFATVAQIAGMDSGLETRRDSVSFLPSVVDTEDLGARRYLFSEVFIGNYHAMAVRDDEFKYIRRAQDVNESFHRYVEGAIDEGPDLLQGELSGEEAEAYERLVEHLADQRRWMRKNSRPAEL